MIEINVQKHSDKWNLAVKGHADYAPKGHDIVCAACSILVYTLVSSLQKRGADFSCRDNGEITIKAKREENSNILFDTVVNGFVLLAETYPENVSVHF